MRDPDLSLERHMSAAIEEAETSLREGNHGFGAVIARGDDVVAREHDTEETESDPTAHAESKAIRKASAVLGKDLAGCVLVSTHEPCPMCAGAIVWSGLRRIAYGIGIPDAMAQGRRRLGLPCEQVFSRCGAAVEITKDVLRSRCALLYDERVRSELRKLRGATDRMLIECNEASTRTRLAWYAATQPVHSSADPLQRAYELLLRKLEIDPSEAPIVENDGHRLRFHSRNFCPTLEACRILRLDTRRVCRLSNEGATNALVRMVDARLSFSRNYETLRPYGDCCEEMIDLGTGPG